MRQAKPAIPDGHQPDAQNQQARQSHPRRKARRQQRTNRHRVVRGRPHQAQPFFIEACIRRIQLDCPNRQKRRHTKHDRQRNNRAQLGVLARDVAHHAFDLRPVIRQRRPMPRGLDELPSDRQVEHPNPNLQHKRPAVPRRVDKARDDRCRAFAKLAKELHAPRPMAKLLFASGLGERLVHQRRVRPRDQRNRNAENHFSKHDFGNRIGAHVQRPTDRVHQRRNDQRAPIPNPVREIPRRKLKQRHREPKRTLQQHDLTHAHPDVVLKEHRDDRHGKQAHLQCMKQAQLGRILGEARGGGHRGKGGRGC